MMKNKTRVRSLDIPDSDADHRRARGAVLYFRISTSAFNIRSRALYGYPARQMAPPSRPDHKEDSYASQPALRYSFAAATGSAAL